MNKERLIKEIKSGNFKNIESIDKILNKEELFNITLYLSSNNLLNKELSIFLASMIIKYKDPFYNFTYALEIKNAPIKDLFYETVKLGNMQAIILFLDKFKSLDISILINYLKEKGSVNDIITMIKKYPNIPRVALYNKVLSSKTEDIYNFSKKISLGSYLNVFQCEIINRNNPMYIYLFARDVKGVKREVLGKAILSTYSSKYIYLFTKDFNVLEEKDVLTYLDMSDDVYYIYLYYKDNYHISLENFLEYSEANATLLCHFPYEVKLKYLIYLIDNKDNPFYQDKLHCYREFLMEEYTPIDKAKLYDLEYHKHINNKNISLERKLNNECIL